MQSQTHRSIRQFFFRGSLTRALFRWLHFEQYVRGGRKLSVPSSDPHPTQHQDWLALWENQESTQTPMSSWLLVWTLGSAFFGAAAMLGLLSASHVAGVNIWAALLMFAALPLLLVGMSAAGALLPIRGLTGHPVMAMVFRKMGLQSFRSAVRLLIPWLQWQLQRGGIAFMISALITFFVFATFQDVRFVWSSTFIESSATMHRMLSILAWPWHWWLAPPDMGAVELARFRTGVSLDASVNDAGLWPFVVTCMVVYGLLPRLLIAVLFRFRFRQRLSREISRSSLPDQFFTIQQHAISRAALSDLPEDDVLAEVKRDPQTQRLVGWRMPSTTVGLDWNLGVGRWQDDEQWLKDTEFQDARPVLILIELWQAPMGELSDCLVAMQQRGAQVILMLTGRSSASDRADAQERSWRYFAQKNQVELVWEAEQ